MSGYAKTVERARRESTAEHIFPKLVEGVGEKARIKDNPPLIYHLTAAQRKAEYHGALAQAIGEYRDSLPEYPRVLFDRFQYRDIAMKVVGVGSVGTMCLVALFTASDEDALFLQIKESRASVLEPFAGFLHGKLLRRDFYARQLRDMKIKIMLEGADPDSFRAYARICGQALARAYARSGDAALLSGYMGSSREFDDAIVEFSVAYADQTERDYKAFLRAIRYGRLKIAEE